jgi:pyruvate dehydrogenase E1 component
MLHRQKDVFYYVTVTNSNCAHPPMPDNAEQGILRGMYLLRPAKRSEPCVTLLGSGPVLREAIAAAELLEERYGIDANVWSVTSFSQLRWDGMAAERWNRLHPECEKKASWIELCLKNCRGPIVGVSDYVRSVADMIRPWVPGPYVTLGTDGFGRSDTRAALRSFFEIDRDSIVVAALSSLAYHGLWERADVAEAIEKLGVETREPNPWDV